MRLSRRDGHVNRAADRVGTGAARPGLVSLQPVVAGRCTLFCLHHAGGGAASFRNWPRLVGPSIQVATVVLPGREASFGQPPMTEFEAVIERICDEIQSLTDRPYALYGHSLGATLAFEASCRLERRCPRVPSCVIVSGRPALHLPNAATGGSTCGAARRTPSSLPDAEFIDLLRRMGGTPAAILDSPEMLQVLLPIIRADFRLAENYRWDNQSRSARPLLVLGGTEDRYADPEKLALWRELTTGDVTIRRFDGGHFFVTSSEVEVCGAITEFLERHGRTS